MVKSYASAGVNIAKVKGIHAHVERMLKSTHSPEVMPIYGHYAGLVRTGKETIAMHTDGVGTKVLVAHEFKKYDTIGIDCIAMNVNDIICVGAKPTALVDYLALQHEDEPLVRELMKGLVKGAKEAGVSLIGGETAIMPDLIKGEKGKTGFDLAGASIGVMRGKPITGERMRPGNAVIGLASSGVHSNGLTLARKALPKKHWKELLTPTRIYVKPVMEILASVTVHGMAHITGGAFSKLRRIGNYAKVGFMLDNMPKPLKVFRLLMQAGICEREMYKTFNMGVGYCIICSQRDGDKVVSICKKHKLKASVIGEITKKRKIVIKTEQTFEV
ncbi:MAG: phosphoribosylformylglycinamidine cyclo-ligase [Candidatus Micrarchaeota archaeon]